MQLRKIATAVATSALIFNAFATSAFATTIEVSGNGSDSQNNANLSVKQSTTVVQNNNANIVNNVNANAGTGGNDASRNTGGNVSIDTGNATTDVKVNNTANKNVANVNCCVAKDTSVLISGNGADSKNTANLGLSNSTHVFQDNNANIGNWVSASSDTGNNDASRNTGGDVSITTGDASTTVKVSNTANANMAKIGNGSSDKGSLSARIVGNGADSKNNIKVNLASSTVVKQDNNANIKNKIDADADSGGNDASRNTGGDVSIDTGNAKVKVGVDNKVNFNWASADCGCLLADDVTLKIAGNGAKSKNNIKFVLSDNTLQVFQDNCRGQQLFDGELDAGFFRRCGLNNDVDANGDTGNNDTGRNTGAVSGRHDPTSITTEDADVKVDVNNKANANIFGTGLDLPDLGKVDLTISLDLSDLMKWLKSHLA